MSGPTFVDTNILVYAFAGTGDERHAVARTVVGDLLERQNAALSVQVLKEFYAVATRKLGKPLPARKAASIIRDLMLACHVTDDTQQLLERALDLAATYSLSIWDASIVAAAEAAGCREVCKEDPAHGATIGSVRIANPFIAGAPNRSGAPRPSQDR